MPRKVTIWKLTYQSDPEPGRMLAFLPTREHANHAFDDARRIQRDNGNEAHSQTIIPLQITLTKEGILQLLEYHCSGTDNG